MTDAEILSVAHHEAGHFLVATHFRINAWPVLTPHNTACPGVCRYQDGLTSWQFCVVGWGGILAEALTQPPRPAAPPFAPTGENLRDWHGMMFFKLDNLSKSDQEAIRGDSRRSWPACKLAFNILSRDLPRLKRVAADIAKPHLGKSMEIQYNPIASLRERATVLETFLRNQPADYHDRPWLTKILACLQAGVEPPAELFPPGPAAQLRTTLTLPPKLLPRNNMENEMQNNFDRLRQWSKALALTVDDILPQMQDALDGKVELPKGCSDNTTAAAFTLRQIEKKMAEVVSAFADIKKVLTPDTANRHGFIHVCASGNRMHGQVSFWWDSRPTDKDMAEALPWGKVFGSQSPDHPQPPPDFGAR